MKVFLSWSGDESRQIAEALKVWLVLLFPTMDVWISSQDVKAGDRWANELSLRLEQTDFGILCLTKENVDSAWILYEAGALSKSIDAGRIVPFLHGLEYSNLPGPLTHFQSVKADRDGTRKLVQTISSVLPGNRRPDSSIEKVFNLSWPDLEAALCNPPSKAQIIAPEESPTVQFLKSEGSIVIVEGIPISLSEKEYRLYLFLAMRSAEGAASFPYYKAMFREFEKWLQVYFPKNVWPRHGNIVTSLSSVVSTLRKKFTRAGLGHLEQYLLPHKGRIGVKVNLDSDLFVNKE